MAKTVVWNRRASDSFDSIISYLQSEWGEKVTKEFIARTFRLIELLAVHPEIGSIQHFEKQIRGIVITKHNTLFYRIENERLILLHFFDNRQNPKKRLF